MCLVKQNLFLGTTLFYTLYLKKGFLQVQNSVLFVPFAQAAARALMENTGLDAAAIVERALGIAADICVYTNRNLVIEKLP